MATVDNASSCNDAPCRANLRRPGMVHLLRRTLSNRARSVGGAEDLPTLLAGHDLVGDQGPLGVGEAGEERGENGRRMADGWGEKPSRLGDLEPVLRRGTFGEGRNEGAWGLGWPIPAPEPPEPWALWGLKKAQLTRAAGRQIGELTPNLFLHPSKHGLDNKLGEPAPPIHQPNPGTVLSPRAGFGP